MTDHPQEPDWLDTDDFEPQRDRGGLPWPGERCKHPECRRRLVVSYEVDDDVWEDVVGEGLVICLQCFDRLAQQKGITYDVKMIDPVRWHDWEWDQTQDEGPDHAHDMPTSPPAHRGCHDYRAACRWMEKARQEAQSSEPCHAKVRYRLGFVRWVLRQIQFQGRLEDLQPASVVVTTLREAWRSNEDWSREDIDTLAEAMQACRPLDELTMVDALEWGEVLEQSGFDTYP